MGILSPHIRGQEEVRRGFIRRGSEEQQERNRRGQEDAIKIAYKRNEKTHYWINAPAFHCGLRR
jgi:hypothetical protein